jgi:hypothetical protein
MDTQSFRLFFILLFCTILADDYFNVDRQKIILNRLFTHSSYPSINFALQQIESLQMDIEFQLNSTEDVLPVCYLKIINIRIFFFFFFFCFD